MKQKIPFQYHVYLFAGLFLFLAVWDISIKGTPFSYTISAYALMFGVSHLLAVFLVYLLNFYLLCPVLLNRRRILLYILSMPFSLLLFTGLRYTLEEVVIYHITGSHNYAPGSLDPVFYIRDNFFFGMPSVLLSALAYLSWQAHVYQKRNRLLEIENRKAQFALLKSQVSPHFLFNTLNSFYSKWAEKDEEAASGILTLSDLLRYVITESDKEVVTLERELEFVQNYIGLHRKRFENQMYFDYTVDGIPEGRGILPAVLIHFVENVFKHGVLSDKSREASMRVAILDGTLEVYTRNYIQRGDNYSSTGIGYKNLSDRLRYAYGDDFILEKNTENNIFTTYLKLPLSRL